MCGEMCGYISCGEASGLQLCNLCAGSIKANITGRYVYISVIFLIVKMFKQRHVYRLRAEAFREIRIYSSVFSSCLSPVFHSSARLWMCERGAAAGDAGTALLLPGLPACVSPLSGSSLLPHLVQQRERASLLCAHLAAQVELHR